MSGCQHLRRLEKADDGALHRLRVSCSARSPALRGRISGNPVRRALTTHRGAGMPVHWSKSLYRDHDLCSLPAAPSVKGPCVYSSGRLWDFTDIHRQASRW